MVCVVCLCGSEMGRVMHGMLVCVWGGGGDGGGGGGGRRDKENSNCLALYSIIAKRIHTHSSIPHAHTNIHAHTSSSR